jgi:hypothetical protein
MLGGARPRHAHHQHSVLYVHSSGLCCDHNHLLPAYVDNTCVDGDPSFFFARSSSFILRVHHRSTSGAAEPGLALRLGAGRHQHAASPTRTSADAPAVHGRSKNGTPVYDSYGGAEISDEIIGSKRQRSCIQKTVQRHRALQSVRVRSRHARSLSLPRAHVPYTHQSAEMPYVCAGQTR